MTPRPNCPLGDKHCEALDKALRQSAEAIQLATDCKDCGLPVDDLLERLTAQQTLASKLKAKFFPHRL